MNTKLSIRAISQCFKVVQYILKYFIVKINVNFQIIVDFFPQIFINILSIYGYHSSGEYLVVNWYNKGIINTSKYITYGERGM